MSKDEKKTSNDPGGQASTAAAEVGTPEAPPTAEGSPGSDAVNRNPNANRDTLERDDGGNLINPPVIPEYERRITEAANAGDEGLIEHVQGEYNDARVKLAQAKENQG